MPRERKTKSFLPKPIYRGGGKAMSKFIADQIQYPGEAIQHKIEGTVVLRVQIDYKGKVIGSKIRSGIGYGCNEEAQRVVSLLSFDIDNKVRRGKVLFHRTINIHFQLSKASSKKTAGSDNQTQLSYVITEKKKDKPSTSYNYTITY